jgi:hypothetical protein
MTDIAYRLAAGCLSAASGKAIWMHSLEQDNSQARLQLLDLGELAWIEQPTSAAWQSCPGRDLDPVALRPPVSRSLPLSVAVCAYSFSILDYRQSVQHLYSVFLPVLLRWTDPVHAGPIPTRTIWRIVA